MMEHNTFNVYDNDTNECIKENEEYCYIEEYLDNKKYAVIWNLNGMDLNKE